MMQEWTFRLSGQFLPDPGYQRTFRVGRVAARDAHSQKFLQLFDPHDTVIAEFSKEAVFGYMKEDGEAVRVWLRVPSATDECQLKIRAGAVKDGGLNGIETIDLFEISSKDAKPAGRLIADWVLSYALDVPDTSPASGGTRTGATASNLPA